MEKHAIKLSQNSMNATSSERIRILSVLVKMYTHHLGHLLARNLLSVSGADGTYASFSVPRGAPVTRSQELF